MKNKYKILVIEDEVNICNFVRTILETNGYRVLVDHDGSGGKIMFRSHCPDLIILDLGLPDIDGVDFIREVRKNSETPIIVLSARVDEKDKVSALDLGANDYVTKPFGTDELLARVRVALRDNRRSRLEGGGNDKKHILKDLVIDYEARIVTMKGTEVKLTQTEYNIVELLSLYEGKVLTYTEIVKKVWGYSDSGSIKKLQVNMANIRKKLGEKPGDNQYISNELGVGYRMMPDAKEKDD